MRLRRDDVIDAAMALLDERGLDELTTRRLADRLGVRVGAIYWHVRDKHELLTELTDRILSQAMPTDLPGGQDWPGQLTRLADRLRAAMLRHPDGARLVAAYAPSSPRSLPVTEAWLRSMLAAGLPLPTAAYAWDTLMSYVTGFVLQEQATPARAAPDTDTDADEPAATTQQPAASAFPTLAAWAATKPASKDEAFTAGVDFIITGIRVRLFDEPPSLP